VTRHRPAVAPIATVALIAAAALAPVAAGQETTPTETQAAPEPAAPAAPEAPPAATTPTVPAPPQPQPQPKAPARPKQEPDRREKPRTRPKRRKEKEDGPTCQEVLELRTAAERRRAIARMEAEGRERCREIVANFEEEQRKKRAERRRQRAAARGNSTLGLPGPAPIGVPDFLIERFRIPPFLLPIYQAAGAQYGVRWELLAAINEIESDFGRNTNVSSAGAVGWMQFMPATWRRYGVDANADGRRDPYNPVDAIFAAARYLKAAGVAEDPRRAVFAYNHADWYVDDVVGRARLIGRLPADLVSSLTGLTEGLFPVHAKARYGKAIHRKDDPSIRIRTRAGAPVVAVADGVVRRVGRSPKLGRFIELQDAYGNRYLYSRLGSVASHYPAPKEERQSEAEIRRELRLPDDDPKPRGAASGRRERPALSERGSDKPGRTPKRTPARDDEPDRVVAPARRDEVKSARASGAKPTVKHRVFAHPRRLRAFRAGGDRQVGADETVFNPHLRTLLALDEDELELRRLRKGSRVVAGTLLGRVGRPDGGQPQLDFAIRPAGRGAPRIDPEPILDGWRLLESTALYRVRLSGTVFAGLGSPSIGQLLLMGKEPLARRVLADPRIDIYDCGRRDIRAGRIDRRVLATLAVLAESGLHPTVSSLQCGHSYLTKSGSVSHHSTGTAMDIGALNDVPVLGHQGKGSITEEAVQRLLTLQGTMRPEQIITLMTFDGHPNTYAMGDHADHIHVGWDPAGGDGVRLGAQMAAVLEPGQWTDLAARLGKVKNPRVRSEPSRYSLRAAPRLGEELGRLGG
jgi:murein DD-endopeptidase MepM/ murein hydrolase activator NlpD